MSVKTASSHGKEGGMMRTCFINVGRDWFQYSTLPDVPEKGQVGKEEVEDTPSYLGFRQVFILFRSSWENALIDTHICQAGFSRRSWEGVRSWSWVSIFSSMLLDPQPCSYSIWPLTTFLSAIPFLSSYLHSTSLLEEESYLGCYWVPPFNEKAHQVFQNYTGKM